MTEDFVAHPALLDLLTREWEEVIPQCMYLDLREKEDFQETKETRVFASHIKMVSKVIPAHPDQEVNLARMESMD